MKLPIIGRKAVKEIDPADAALAVIEKDRKTARDSAGKEYSAQIAALAAGEPHDIKRLEAAMAALNIHPSAVKADVQTMKEFLGSTEYVNNWQEKEVELAAVCEAKNAKLEAALASLKTAKQESVEAGAALRDLGQIVAAREIQFAKNFELLCHMSQAADLVTKNKIARDKTAKSQAQVEKNARAYKTR